MFCLSSDEGYGLHVRLLMWDMLSNPKLPAWLKQYAMRKYHAAFQQNKIVRKDKLVLLKKQKEVDVEAKNKDKDKKVGNLEKIIGSMDEEDVDDYFDSAGFKQWAKEYFMLEDTIKDQENRIESLEYTIHDIMEEEAKIGDIIIKNEDTEQLIEYDTKYYSRVQQNEITKMKATKDTATSKAKEATMNDLKDAKRQDERELKKRQAMDERKPGDRFAELVKLLDKRRGAKSSRSEGSGAGAGVGNAGAEGDGDDDDITIEVKQPSIRSNAVTQLI